MKRSDDYRAKVKLWAERPAVAPLLPGPDLPKFPAQRFRTHEEMNRWKQGLLREVARTVACRG